MQPRDAAHVAAAPDVAELHHVPSRDLDGFVLHPVDRYLETDRRAELVHLHAVVKLVVCLVAAADSLRADEPHAGAAAIRLEELREEIPIARDLAEDEALRPVEIHLPGGVECPRLGTSAVLECAFC